MGISTEGDKKDTRKIKINNKKQDIAILGMSCRFPEAKNYKKFWNNLEQGINSIKEIPPERWNHKEYFSTNSNDINKSISKWCGLVDDINQFDNRFFNISPREAANMDPQQRILMEETWHCIEDSGISFNELRKKKTSVFVGVMAVDYRQEALMTGVETDSFACLGGYESILANRISYYFDFKGKSVSINAACASTLVALNDAKISIEIGESDYAIVAGVNLNIHPWKYISFSKSRMLSPIGQCKTFDSSADGYVPGDGIGVFLLSGLENARNLKCSVYGLVKGIAVNHGGRSNSITAPRIEAQRDVIVAAYEDSGVNPDTITYLEAHGTGTSLGDPIEIEALTQAYSRFTQRKQFCMIGSVKTNIGHLEAAAGAASLVKILMMIKNRKIPPTINLTNINPIIEFDKSPFIPADHLVDWKPMDETLPLRAGISSFGFGGVNSHVVIEEVTEKEELEKRSGEHEYIFALSARTQSAFEKLREEWLDFTRNTNEEDFMLESICLTQLTGRKGMTYRTGSFVQDRKSMVEFLENVKNDGIKANQKAQWMMILGDDILSCVPKVVKESLETEMFYAELKVTLRAIKDKKYHSLINATIKYNACNKTEKRVISFVFSYTFIKLALEMGFKPEIISGVGNGRMLGMVLSGMMSINDAVEIIEGKLKTTDIKMHRPEIPYMDGITGKVIKPLEFDRKYIEALLSSLKGIEEFDRKIVEKSRILLTNQYTFKKYMDEWEEEAVKHSLGSLLEAIADSSLLEEGYENKAIKDIVIIAIVCSLKKLNLKWGLKERREGRSSRFFELVDLICDGVIPKEMFIGILSDQNTDYGILVAAMEKRQEQINWSNPYKHLKTKNKFLPEKGIYYLFEKQEIENVSVPLEKYSVLCFELTKLQGLKTHVNASIKNTDLIHGFKKCLMGLWCNGVDIDWIKLYKEGTFKKARLPLNPFEGKAFWLYDKNSSNASIGKSNIADSSWYERVSFYSHNVEIRDHIILGKTIVPAAVMIIEASKVILNKISKSELVMSGIMVKAPLVMSGCDELSSEILIDRQSFSLKLQDNHIITGNLNNDTDKEYFRIHSIDDSRLMINMQKEQIYKTLDVKGYQYGEAFKVIDRGGLNSSGNRVFKFCKNNPEELEQCFPQAIIIDGLFQAALVSAYFEGLIYGEEDIYIPYFIGKIFWSSINKQITYAVILKDDLVKRGGDLYVSISGCDASGKELIRVCDMVFKRVKRNFLSEYKGASCYKYEWKEKELISKNSLQGQRNAVIFGEGDSVEDALVKQAIDKYRNVVVVKKGDKFRFDGSEVIWINPNNEEDYAKLVTELKNFSGANNKSYDMFYLWNTSVQNPFTGTGESLERAFVQEMQTILYLLKYWGKLQITAEVKLVLLGQDSQIVAASDTGAGITKSSIPGFLRSAEIETAKFTFKYIDINTHDYQTDYIVPILFEEINQTGQEDVVAYRNKRRYAGNAVRMLSYSKKSIFVNSSLGAYVITGGAGGIGIKLASVLAIKSGAYVIMLGRSLLSEELSSIIKSYVEKGIKLKYISCDVTDYRKTGEVILSIIEKYGQIRGVIHAAGVIDDGLLAGKSMKSLMNVARPKVLGAYYLHLLTKEQPLEFFVMFSSIVAVMGNAGQTDYSAANAFMDAFAHYRAANGYPGRSLSINWCLWEDGGMGLNKKHKQIFDRKTGSISSKEAIDTLWGILDSDPVQCIVAGDSFAFENTMKGKMFDLNKEGSDVGLKIEEIRRRLTGILSDILKIPEVELDFNTDIREFGLESVSLNELAERITEDFGINTDAALFFEYSDIRQLSEYISEKHKKLNAKEEAQGKKVDNSLPLKDWKDIKTLNMSLDAENIYYEINKVLIRLLSEVLSISEEELDEESDLRDFGMESVSLSDYCNRINDVLGTDIDASLIFEYSNANGITRYLIDKYSTDVFNYIEKHYKNINIQQMDAEKQTTSVNKNKKLTENLYSIGLRDSDIAIIGVSGRFPGAEDLDEYWKIIKDNRYTVTEIPEDRWNWEEVYGDSSCNIDMTDVKWGGFLKNINTFDASFFKISRREAELMDPQQRIMMEEAWHAIEDAGLKPSDLAGSRTGVYIGVVNTDYDELLIRKGIRLDAYTSTGLYFSVIPNRISYIMNLKGPSLAIDTACSSSLVAIHEAVKSIQIGECDMALAGGVNIIITPRRHFSFSNAGMLSKDGRCKTFDEKADGYVRGEGAGVVLLKPLKKALEDGDDIYSVIKGSAVNHGGYVGTLTKPNPNAQAEVIVTAYEKAGIEPDTVTFIEAHGTGTNLGDPIEINGLKKAFEELYSSSGKKINKTAYCGIGAVKTNIGHLESAAGIAGLIKLIKAMKNGIIPANVNFTKQNPYIKLEGSPFYLVTENRNWHRMKDETGCEVPRRCGISSFGFGGVNAHIVMEEYTMCSENEPEMVENAVVVLSAKNQKILKEYAARIAEVFEEKEDNTSFLNAVYTLQTGREVMEERLAFTANDYADAAKILKEYSEGKASCKIHTGYIRKKRGDTGFSTCKPDTKFNEPDLSMKDGDELARLWVSGVEIDWDKLWKTKKYRIHLPGYPFEKEVHWLPEQQEEVFSNMVKAPEEAFCNNEIEVHNQNSLSDEKLLELLKRLERGQLKSKDVKKVMGV